MNQVLILFNSGVTIRGCGFNSTITGIDYGAPVGCKHIILTGQNIGVQCSCDFHLCNSLSRSEAIARYGDSSFKLIETEISQAITVATTLSTKSRSSIPTDQQTAYPNSSEHSSRISTSPPNSFEPLNNSGNHTIIDVDEDEDPNSRFNLTSNVTNSNPTATLNSTEDKNLTTSIPYVEFGSHGHDSRSKENAAAHSMPNPSFIMLTAVVTAAATSPPHCYT